MSEQEKLDEIEKMLQASVAELTELYLNRKVQAIVDKILRDAGVRK